MPIETKTNLLKNEEIMTDYVKTMEMFGWKLNSIKSINKWGGNEFTGTEDYQRECDAYYEKKLFYYTEFVFERDKSLKHYDQIVKLEEEFFKSIDNIRHPEPRTSDARKINIALIGLLYFTGILAISPVIYELIDDSVVLKSNLLFILLSVSIFFFSIALLFTLINVIRIKKANNLAAEWLERKKIIIEKSKERIKCIPEELKELMQ